ncbi:unnamed protein product, partial [Arabidopsis halleri]
FCSCTPLYIVICVPFCTLSYLVYYFLHQYHTLPFTLLSYTTVCTPLLTLSRTPSN